MNEQPVNKNQALIDNLRAAADHLEKHRMDVAFSASTIYCFAPDAEAFAKVARQFGGFEKHAANDWFNIEKKFGKEYLGQVVLQLTVKRDQICEKVITQRVMPAEPEKIIPEKIVPAKPERVEEIVEWSCPESVLSLAGSESS